MWFGCGCAQGQASGVVSSVLCRGGIGHAAWLFPCRAVFSAGGAEAGVGEWGTGFLYTASHRLLV